MIAKLLKYKKIILLLLPLILLTSYLSYAALISVPNSSSKNKLPASKGQEGADQAFSWFNFFQGNQRQPYSASLEAYGGESSIYNLAARKTQSGYYEGLSESSAGYYAPAAASALSEDTRAAYYYQHIAADAGPGAPRLTYQDAGPGSPGVYYGSGVSVKNEKNALTIPQTPASTPIPATFSLLGSGLFLLGFLRKRYFL